MKRITCGLLFALTIGICLPGAGQDLAETAKAFMALLTAEQLEKATFPVDTDERTDWTFVPRARKGIPFKQLNPKQREAALNLLRASLSQQGYTKATEIMAHENILRELEGRGPNDTYRDPENYYVSIFGTPSSKGPWGWRLEGHHVALNFFSIDGTLVSSTPSGFGSNPATVPRGPQTGKQILKLESDLGFQLVNSLTAAQLKVAKFSDTAPYEMFTLGEREATPLEPKGLSYREMTSAQQKMLLSLLDVYVRNYAFGFSNRLMKKIQDAGIENLYFAWAGSLQPGAGHYYRIQGPMLLIEFDNTQNNANHIHTAVRDLTDDFAYDILKEHYARDHNNK
ncbi:MAG: DUF3500 domain-containing protein [Bacteroidota bacterium]|jgi:hypothetical protein|nr:MAG: hypothetical protein DIU61_03485 [Bacteroidota bacterium]